MFFPLALAPYIPAAAAGIGAFAKGLSGGRGQRIVQGGVNLANKGLTSLQNVSQPYLQNIVNKFATSGPVTGYFGAETALKPTESTIYNTAKAIVTGAEWLTGSEERQEEIPKQFAEMFGVDIDQALIDAGTELIEKEEKKKLKKGGYVKKQRKRKPYKSSAFVKMKKSKKRKYIKT